MKRFVWTDLTNEERKSALARPSGLSDPAIQERVSAILVDVKARGDNAVLEYTREFDAPAASTLEISAETLKAAWDSLPGDQKTALETAKSNIEAFHSAQGFQDITVETMPGVTCRRISRPIETVGLYVPGGTAPLVSTLLMLAVPASVAGCTNRIIVTPPGKDDAVNPAILAAAYLAGVSQVFACGGAQAIAALAYGTESIARCDKIFGPGNAYVATAKSLVSSEPGGPAIDLPAGPSEAMVAADASANPEFVAADLLSQAEHDTLAQVICVCTNAKIADEVNRAVKKQLETLPRQDIASEAIAASRMFVTETDLELLEIINSYAPEHLILQLDNPDRLISGIRNAGSIFMGHWTPESVGDYASGTNHTLPTNGAAKAYSGVTLENFMTTMTIQSLTPDGLERIGPTVETLAAMEGLEAHRRAVALRRETI